MRQEFSKLSTSEKELVFKAPLLVCILIAGADGKIDSKELSEAIDISRDHSLVKANLAGYFKEVSQDFEDKIKMLIQAYPYETVKRNEAITQELSQLNELWSKLGPEFSSALFDLLKYIGQRIATSSGNFLRKISAEEAELVSLPMLQNPVK